MSIPKEGSRDIGDGIIISVTPDVCLTPVGSSTVPIPYSVFAYQSDDANTAATVRMTGKRSHNLASVVTATKGGAPGSSGGVVSGTVGAACHPKGHSATVNIQGKPAVRHGDEWWMNNKNTVGKLTYVKSTEAFDPTHAIILAQNSALEAPDQDRVDSYIEAILGGMARARAEGVPEGSYQVAQALPAQVWQPLDLADRLGRIPNSIPSTRPPANRTPSPANDNARPVQPLPNRIARESAMRPLSSQQVGPAPGAPGGAAGQAISQVWQYADELMSGHALGISPNIYREASAAEAALRQWAADYSAAHGGSPVPEFIWGTEQDSLNAVRLPGMQGIRDAIRAPSEARAILRDYADMNGISPRDLSEEEIRDILASEDPMAVPRPSPIAQSEATPEQVRITKDEDRRKEKCARTVSVDSSRAPQSTRHMLDAWAKGYPSVLTLCKACAIANRAASLRGIPRIDNMDRDEYPPAMFLEGGVGASVRHLPYSDNRSAGAQIGNQLRSVPEGCRITITIR